MANEDYFSQFEEAPNENYFGQFEEDVSVPSKGWEDFYRASGIYGANEAFANMFGAGKHKEISRKRAAQARETNPIATGLGGAAAQIYGSAPFFMAGGMAAEGIPAISNFAKAITGGALGGGAMGAVKTPDEGESRVNNILSEMLQGGAMGGVLHGIANAPQAYQSGKQALKELTPAKYSQEKTAKEALKIYKDLSSYFNKGYKSVLNQKGVPKVQINANERFLQELYKTSPSVKHSVQKAVGSNKAIDAHKAASKLGKYIAREQRRIMPNDKGIDMAQRLKTKLEKNLDTALDQVPGIKNAYRGLDREFEQSLAFISPQIRNKLNLYEKGYIGSQDVLRKIRSPEAGESFRHKFKEQLPGIETAKYPEDWKNLPVNRNVYNLFTKYFGDKK